MKRYVIIASLIMAAQLQAQVVRTDSVYVLEGSSVNVQRVKDYNAGNREKVLTLPGYGSVAEMLANSGAVFVKQYGQGTLASTAMRGLSASQVAVLWNGLSVQSPMNGMYDLNLIPTFFIDNANIEYGGSSAIYGNGALAGAINLNNSEIIPGKAELLAQYGSFGLQNYGVKASYGNSRLSGQTKVLRSVAKNDYEYNDYFKINKPLVRQQNADYLQQGIMQELSLKTSSYSRLSGRFWYNVADRQLPPPIGTSNQAREHQYDDAYRAMVSYSYSKGNWDINNRNAFFREQINYYNANLPNSYNIAKSLITETDANYRINAKHTALLGINATWNTAKSDGYPNWPQQYLTSLYAGWKYKSLSRKLAATVNARQLFSSVSAKPLTGSAGIDWLCLPYLLLQANVAASYRMPTFNDLYWAEGGNTQLKPEQGFKQEIGARYKIKNFSAEVHLFRNAVNNWIIWLPAAGSGIWTPRNIRFVESSGIEASLKYIYSAAKFKMLLQGNYSYTRSENKKAEAGNESIIDKQLIYVPVHTAAVSASLVYANWQLKIEETYTGLRYTSSDNTQELPSFMLLNAQLSKSFYTKNKQRAELMFRVNNCLDKRYEVVERRPMPGINFLASLRLNLDFNHIFKHTEK